jgi:hypothetical protein
VSEALNKEEELRVELLLLFLVGLQLLLSLNPLLCPFFLLLCVACPLFVSVYPRGRAILLLYVDDIKLTGDYSVTISLIKCRLHQLFAMKALTRPKPFLGLEVAHSPRGYLVSQIK